MASISPTTALSDEPLTQRAVLSLYRPLALSWIFMAIEGPMSVAIIARRPEGQVNTAAFLVLMSLALWIESPVIDLLSTSTTLGRNRRAYEVLTRFAFILVGVVTVAHVLVAATPLYGLITRDLLDIPEEVSDAARLGMLITIPWSGLIGWRRYLQGLLIRHRKTRLIGWGTGLRVAMMGTASLSLFYATDWPGISIAATALVLSVGAEALFVHGVSRKVIRDAYPPTEDTDDAPQLTLASVVKFHVPLTATTMLMLTAGLVVSAALARAPNSVLSLAAWQVASTVLFMHRTVVFALPEVVVALYRDAASAQTLRRFCITVGWVMSASIVLFGVLGIDRWFFSRVLGSKDDTVATAHIAYLVGAGLPLLGALQSYVRGMLTSHHLTVARLQAVLVAMAVLVVSLSVGVALRWPGVVTAGLALTVSMAAELWALTLNWRKGRARAGTRGPSGAQA